MFDLPDVYFGTIGKQVDWRNGVQDDTPDDDELLTETPGSIIRLLGFDPAGIREGNENGNVELPHPKA